MGMASSQARLLTLTSRLHSIELKAQKIEAEKLRLANDSDHVYNTYLDKLEATKIQYSALTSDGTMTFKDATLNAMENGVTNWAGETSKNVLFLQNQDGKVLVTPAVAAKYGLVSSATETRDLDTFVRDTTGKDKTPQPVYRQEPVYRDEPVMGTREVPDEDTIVNFTRLENNVTKTPEISSSHTFNPVENIEGGIDYSALESYAKFDDSHTNPGSGVPSVPADASALPAGTYTISSANDLKALNGKSIGADVKLVLTQDIDMSGVTGWTGISNFAGTFDGNGYKITNLKGSQGLFAQTNGATIQNIGLENLDINGNSSFVGGLIGNAKDTNIINCYTTGSVTNSASGSISTMTNDSYSCGTGGLVGHYSNAKGVVTDISNVYSSAKVTATSMDGVGGLIGTADMYFGNTAINIHDAYAIGEVKGRNGVGGFIGVMYNDEDNASDITDIRNCYSGGNVYGGSYVGGFWGSYTYWGDNQDYCEIEGCNSSGKVNGTSSTTNGAFGGVIFIKSPDLYGEHAYVKFINCGYAKNTGVPNGYGSITDYAGADVTDYVLSSGSASGLVSFKMAGSVPTIKSDGSGEFMQNILAVLTKDGLYDPCAGSDMSAADKTAMETKVKNFLKSFSDNDTDNAKLWYLNDAIIKYLNGTGASGLGAALAQDINNGTKTSTASFQTGAALEGKVGRANTNNVNVISGTHTNNKGSVTIPSRNNIATSAYYALKMQDKDVDVTEADIKAWINRHYSVSNAQDKMYLANINNYIQRGSNLNNILSAIKSDTKFTMGSLYPVDEYDVTVLTTDQTIGVEYGTKTETYDTGAKQKVLDHYEDVFDHNEYAWDTTDPDIANAIAMYAMAKRGVIVVTEEQASSYNWLTNMISVGEAVFTTFDPAQAGALAGMTPEQIDNMTDAEYEEMMGIKNTSVSVETFIMEVPDEKGLKKAEAEYEADMNKINKKDRLYDTQLAKLEPERNAIKEEIDTLKTVAKENVDRTFKLFS